MPAPAPGPASAPGTGLGNQASPDQTSVIVLTAEPRTPVGLTHRLKMAFGPAGWLATAYHDPYLALAELCLRERAQASRVAWGLQRIERLALVIVDPLRWNLPGAGIADLIAAIKRYTPSASIWSYRDGQLQAVASARPQQSGAADHDMTVMDVDERDWPAEIETRPIAPGMSNASQGQPRGLRLAGGNDEREMAGSVKNGSANPDQDGESPAISPGANPAMVTREEIDLLLRRDADDDGGGPRESSEHAGSSGFPGRGAPK